MRIVFSMFAFLTFAALPVQAFDPLAFTHGLDTGNRAQVGLAYKPLKIETTSAFTRSEALELFGSLSTKLGRMTELQTTVTGVGEWRTRIDSGRTQTPSFEANNWTLTILQTIHQQSLRRTTLEASIHLPVPLSDNDRRYTVAVDTSWVADPLALSWFLSRTQPGSSSENWWEIETGGRAVFVVNDRYSLGASAVLSRRIQDISRLLAGGYVVFRPTPKHHWTTGIELEVVSGIIVPSVVLTHTVNW